MFEECRLAPLKTSYYNLYFMLTPPFSRAFRVSCRTVSALSLAHSPYSDIELNILIFNLKIYYYCDHKNIFPMAKAII